MQLQKVARIARILALPLIGGLLVGCESSGPEFAGGDTRIVEGRLVGATAPQSEFFMITSSGTVSIQLTTLSVTQPETEEPLENPQLGVSVGQPNSEDETRCQLTFAQLLEPGESFSVSFPEGLFCVAASKAPGTSEETVVDYVLTLTGAFS